MEEEIKIKFKNKREIRMGSPYNFADIEISGIDLNLPKFSWQDKYVISKNIKTIILVYFEFQKNEPTFKLYKIDIENGKAKSSKRILGLLNKIQIVNETIKINKFVHDKTKSLETRNENGEICCNFNEEIELEF